MFLGYFGSIDTFSHVYGPSSNEATDAYRRIDLRIGEVDEVLRRHWDDWVLIVVSDHVQDTVDGPGIDLRAHLDGDSIVVDEGSAALVSGLLTPEVLSDIEGVEGWTLLGDGNVLAWCEVGRYFGPLRIADTQGCPRWCPHPRPISAGQRGASGWKGNGVGGCVRSGPGHLLGRRGCRSLRRQVLDRCFFQRQLLFFERFDQLRQHLVDVADDPEIGDA